jgi:hypothetical protein
MKIEKPVREEAGTGDQSTVHNMQINVCTVIQICRFAGKGLASGKT